MILLNIFLRSIRKKKEEKIESLSQASLPPLVSDGFLVRGINGLTDGHHGNETARSNLNDSRSRLPTLAIISADHTPLARDPIDTITTLTDRIEIEIGTLALISRSNGFWLESPLSLGS